MGLGRYEAAGSDWVPCWGCHLQTSRRSLIKAADKVERQKWLSFGHCSNFPLAGMLVDGFLQCLIERPYFANQPARHSREIHVLVPCLPSSPQPLVLLAPKDAQPCIELMQQASFILGYSILSNFKLLCPCVVWMNKPLENAWSCTIMLKEKIIERLLNLLERNEKPERISYKS